MIILPKFGLINPINKLKIELLPAPLGPNKPIISPELRLKLISSKICLGWSKT